MTKRRGSHEAEAPRECGDAKGCREDERHTDTDQAQSEAHQEKHGPRDEARHSERDLQRDTDEGLVGLQTMESTENGEGTADVGTARLGGCLGHRQDCEGNT